MQQVYYRGIITKATRIKRYGSVRCYGATWHSSSVLTQRGFRDLPNNVYYSQQYKAAMDKIGKPRYTVVNPCLAEQLHGLPKNWTKATFSEHSKVKKLIKHNEDRLRGVSLFSGVGALDKGLEHAIDVKVYYEKDAVARRVLQSLIHKGMLSPGKIHGDVANAEAKGLFMHILCIYILYIYVSSTGSPERRHSCWRIPMPRYCHRRQESRLFRQTLRPIQACCQSCSVIPAPLCLFRKCGKHPVAGHAAGFR